MTQSGTTQVAAELAHWRGAVDALADLDAVAAPTSWAMLEDYLRLRLRDRLLAAVSGLSGEGQAVAALLASGAGPEQVRPRVLVLRRKYLQVESILDFYGDAVNTRTNPVLGAVLGGLDTIAVDSMEVLLRPLGYEVPPVLVWLDKGSGAAILRAGVRLWGPGGVSPVAAIKLTRHNLSHPTAILHETGHQVAHVTGWTDELAVRAGRGAATAVHGARRALAGVEQRARRGRARLRAGRLVTRPALANVVDGPTSSVHRVGPGDPHPPPLVRVLFNVALCRRWYGSGPWDALATAWLRRHDPDGRRSEGARVAAASIPALPDLVATCTDRPFAAFGRRPIHALADPRRVSPEALDALVRRAGPSLLTSDYLARSESLRIFAVLSSRAPADPASAALAGARLHRWLARLAPVPQPRAA